MDQMENLCQALRRVVASAQLLREAMRKHESHFDWRSAVDYPNIEQIRHNAAQEFLGFCVPFCADLHNLIVQLKATGFFYRDEDWLQGLYFRLNKNRYICMIFTQLTGSLDVIMWTAEDLENRIKQAMAEGSTATALARGRTHQEFLLLNGRVQCFGAGFNIFLREVSVPDRVQEYVFELRVLVHINEGGQRVGFPYIIGEVEPPSIAQLPWNTGEPGLRGHQPEVSIDVSEPSIAVSEPSIAVSEPCIDVSEPTVDEAGLSIEKCGSSTDQHDSHDSSKAASPLE